MVQGVVRSQEKEWQLPLMLHLVTALKIIAVWTLNVGATARCDGETGTVGQHSGLVDVHEW